MTQSHVFVETNFLVSVFRMPSKRHREALTLRMRFEAGEIKLYIPYLCFQEARNVISKSLRNNRWPDILEFHRFAAAEGTAAWDFNEITKLMNAAAAEVSRTKAVYQHELGDFAQALGDGILHGTRQVFDLLEPLELDDDALQYNDKLILCSVLAKAKELHSVGVQKLYFASLDKKDLEPTKQRTRLTQYYADAGLRFVPGFVIPDVPAPPA